VVASRTIFVAGAGIGGLTAALALAGKGFRVVILERPSASRKPAPVLQLSPNASRVLIELDCSRGLPHARDARRHQHHERATRRRNRAPAARRGRGVPRRRPLLGGASADLQAALQAHVDDNPDIELRLGCQFEDAVSHARG